VGWRAEFRILKVEPCSFQFGSQVPTFEARTDGPYVWLNSGYYLSSNPGVKPGGVGITCTK